MDRFKTDTTFLFQVIGLAQNAQDSSRVLEWTEEAAVRIASEVDAALQRAREAEDEADRLKRVETALEVSRMRPHSRPKEISIPR